MKKDTGGFNGKYYIWIDGELVEKHDNISFNNEPFGKYVILKSNQESPSNGGFAYLFFDDYAISTNPLKMDTHGNRFIGPIDWDNDQSRPDPPTNLEVD